MVYSCGHKVFIDNLIAIENELADILPAGSRQRIERQVLLDFRICNCLATLRGGNEVHIWYSLGLADTLVVREKESFVFEDRPTDVAAELISFERCFGQRGIFKIIAGVKSTVPEEFIGAA